MRLHAALMVMLAGAPLVGVAGAYAEDGARSSASDRSSQDVTSSLVPAVTFRIAGPFVPLPPLTFPIEKLTNAERRVFVIPDKAGNLSKMIVLQFERVQTGADFRFVFPADPPETLGKHPHRFNKFNYDDEEAARKAPDREAARTRRLLLEHGYKPPQRWNVARLARVGDPQGLSEVIVFYMERDDEPPRASEEEKVVSAETARRLLAELRSAVVVVAD